MLKSYREVSAIKCPYALALKMNRYPCCTDQLRSSLLILILHITDVRIKNMQAINEHNSC